MLNIVITRKKKINNSKSKAKFNTPSCMSKNS